MIRGGSPDQFFQEGRRSPLQPPAGALAWWKADAGLTVDGNGRVSQWDDQSGNANHLTQTSSTLRPYKAAAYQNGLDALRWDVTFAAGTPQTGFYFDCPALLTGTMAGSIWFALAAKYNTSANNLGRGLHNFTSNAASNGYPYHGGGGDIIDGFGFSSAVRTITNAANGDITLWRAYGVDIDAGSGSRSGRAYLDNVLKDTETGTKGWRGSALKIGRAANASEWFHGWIGEILVYDRVLTTDERADLYAYLKAKWGLV